MPSDEKDRRRHLRAQIPDIRASLNSPGDVSVLDLSLSGMSFEAPMELAPGDRCFLELRHEGQVVNLEVEIRWSSVRRMERASSRFVPVFRAGAAFLDVLPDQEGGIWSWLVVDPLDEPPQSPD